MPAVYTNTDDEITPSAGNPLELFVPGRVCLFGEHSDWAGSQRRLNSDLRPGACIVAGTDHGIHATVSRHPTLKLRSVTHGGKERTVDIAMSSKELLAVAAEGGFFSYACGVAAQVATSHAVGGLDIDMHTATLPHGKGLSSSAAACVLIARAFNQLYGLQLTTRGEMELAYQGEISTPSRCGRMDQCVAFGRTPVRMDFDGERIDAAPLEVGGEVHMLLVDLGAGKDTTQILHELGAAFPFPKSQAERGLANLLGEYNLQITRRAAAALASGDAEEVGKIMTEAQHEFDTWAAPMCPSQLTSPQLHALLSLEALRPLVHGGKGVGSQGDGTAQLVCRSSEAADNAATLIETTFPRMSCMKLTLGGASEAESSAEMSPEAEERIADMADATTADDEDMVSAAVPEIVDCRSGADTNTIDHYRTSPEPPLVYACENTSSFHHDAITGDVSDRLLVFPAGAMAAAYCAMSVSTLATVSPPQLDVQGHL